MPFEGPWTAPLTRHAVPHVQILLATYNGARYLGAQLDSLTRQSHDAWSLAISDDGSTDHTPAIIDRFAAAHGGRLSARVAGPQRGFAQNFLSLLRIADRSAAYVAFCDQDDVWLPPKLSRALDALGQDDPGRPAMYCGRSYHCDAELRVLRPSPAFARGPGFRNALWQNIGGGNTIVLNASARDLLAEASGAAQDIISHDWWMYQMISGAGGRVHYDARPHLLYRQHDANAVGARQGLRARMARASRLSDGVFRRWTDGNLATLRSSRDALTPEARTILDRYMDLRAGPAAKRPRALARLGLYRQSQAETALFTWLAATGRI